MEILLELHKLLLSTTGTKGKVGAIKNTVPDVFRAPGNK